MTNKSESAADDFSQVAQQFRVFGLRRSLLRYPRRVGAGTGVGVPGNPRIGFSEAGKSLAAVYWPHGTQVGWFATSIGCPGLIPRPTANLTDGADGALDVESDPSFLRTDRYWCSRWHIHRAHVARHHAKRLKPTGA